MANTTVTESVMFVHTDEKQALATLSQQFLHFKTKAPLRN